MHDRELEVAEILASMAITRELYTWKVYTAIVRGLELEFWGASNLHSKPQDRKPIEGWTVRPPESLILAEDDIRYRLYETLRDRQHRFDSAEELIRAILELLDEIEQRRT